MSKPWPMVRLGAHVLGYEIPLPPLAEQRRVVARIEELAAHIHEACTLRHQAAEEAEALLRSILTHDQKAKTTPMRELVKLRSPDVAVRADETYQFAGVYVWGVAFSREHASQGWTLPIRDGHASVPVSSCIRS